MVRAPPPGTTVRIVPALLMSPPLIVTLLPQPSPLVRISTPAALIVIPFVVENTALKLHVLPMERVWLPEAPPSSRVPTCVPAPFMVTV